MEGRKFQQREQIQNGEEMAIHVSSGRGRPNKESGAEGADRPLCDFVLTCNEMRTSWKNLIKRMIHSHSYFNKAQPTSVLERYFKAERQVIETSREALRLIHSY